MPDPTPPPPERVAAPDHEDRIKRFEYAWGQGRAPAIDDYLPPGGAGHYALLVELVHVDLELRLKAGGPARAEDYLTRYPELAGDRDACLELIAAEYALRSRREPELGPDEYLGRFPQYRDDLPALLHAARVTNLGGPAALPPARPARPPAVAGYEVLGELGRGGMGVVYKALDSRLGRSVALKFLPAEYAHDAERLERFRREARTASALNHPSICTVHDLGEHEGRPFLVMEFIEGRTLQDLVGRRLAPEELARLVGQAARALAAAHAAGVVHRDVKPENIMVREDGYVKVLDFGLARRLRTPPAGAAAGDTDPGTLVGTVAYMSPEQAASEPAVQASDVFALGIVLYELATGRHPFAAESSLGYLHAIARQEPVPPSRLNPEVPPSLESLIVHMLAKDPRLRPTAAEVDAALTALVGSPAPAPARPAPAAPPRPSVGRWQERADLHTAFAAAEAGRGLLLSVAGEPGIGKTTLVEDFLAELAAAGRPCRVARGRCSERLAGAEAYLPFLQALEDLLRGEAGGSVARLMKAVAPTWYVQVAPAAADAALPRLTEEARASSQARLKRELVALLRELTGLAPVVLFFDDVHWADVSTVDLLAHVGSQCAALRLLLVLTYRPTELLLEQHPFLQTQRDLQARGACRQMDLNFLGRADVDSYLALTFPGHRFPDDFAALVHAKTEGNPLFLVELLRYLRERGVVAPGPDGWAVAGSVPDLGRELPESVRSLIRRKLDQLDEGDRRLMAAASVQGDEFDSAVLARLLGLAAADAEERLEVLERVHGLVRLRREDEFPDGTLTLRYGFTHVLYQDALYDGLRPTRRAEWSTAAAEALQALHGDRSPAVAAELAVLFEVGRDPGRAADHFLIGAENAARVFAHQEAVVLARRGVAALRPLPATPERAARELPLQTLLGLQLQITGGFAAPGVEEAYTRARDLSDQVAGDPPLFAILWGLWLVYKARSELRQAHALAGQLHALAQKRGDPALVLQSHQALAVTLLCKGEPAATRLHMEGGTALYDPRRHHGHTFHYGQDPGVACLAFGAVALWLLGYPDQAERKSREALALGQELSQPSTQALALHFAAMLHQCRRDGLRAQRCAEAALAIAAEHGFSFWLAGGAVLRGWALAEQGLSAEGTTRLRQGLDAWQATGSVTYRTYYLGLLAEVLGKQGEAARGLHLLDEALALVGRTEEHLYEAELHRLRGELLQAPGSVPGAAGEAEACFRQALAVARAQEARSLELRAAMSLARLHRRQGRAADGLPLLGEVLGRFTEGWDTADLREAKALLAAPS